MTDLAIINKLIIDAFDALNHGDLVKVRNFLNIAQDWFFSNSYKGHGDIAKAAITALDGDDIASAGKYIVKLISLDAETFEKLKKVPPPQFHEISPGEIYTDQSGIAPGTVEEYKQEYSEEKPHDPIVVIEHENKYYIPIFYIIGGIPADGVHRSVGAFLAGKMI